MTTGGNRTAMADLLGGQTIKRYATGTHRACEPEETLDVIRPFLAGMGITRIATVTGLDRIGIPVVMVVRPNSRSLAVAQGKGLTLAAARASGVMESVENYHAERAHCPIWMDSFHHLGEECGVRVVPPERLPLALHSMYSPRRALPWVEATDLVDSAATWVPYELVHANATVPRVPGSGCFVNSTNGLASGNNRAEAVLHGLCEVVERDAAALWWQAPDHLDATRLDLSTVDDPACASMLERFEHAGMAVAAWNMTCDTRIPVFRVALGERAMEPTLRPMPVATGAGCHPDRGVALARALTEAAQSRLTYISGARDDLSRSAYTRSQHPDALAAGTRLGQLRPDTTDRFPPVGFPTVACLTPASTSPPTIEADLRVIVAALGEVGADQVAVVDLSSPERPVAVVRVIVPGLEGPRDSPSYRPGPRARSAGLKEAGRKGAERGDAGRCDSGSGEAGHKEAGRKEAGRGDGGRGR